MQIQQEKNSLETR